MSDRFGIQRSLREALVLAMGRYWNKHKPLLPENPFWTDMSEMGIARRAKFKRDLHQTIADLKKTRPKPADVETNVTVSYDKDADE